MPTQTGNCRVIATFKNGCVDTSAEVMVTSGSALNTANISGASTTDLKKFSVYPNPAGQAATLRFTTDRKDHFNIEITDISGKKVITSQGESNGGDNVVSLLVGDLPAGVYIINLVNGNKTRQSIKLLKE